MFALTRLPLPQIDTDGNGYLDVSELRDALHIVGIKLPQWEVRKILADWDTDTSGPDKGTLSFSEFKKVCLVTPYFVIDC